MSEGILTGKVNVREGILTGKVNVREGILTGKVNVREGILTDKRLCQNSLGQLPPPPLRIHIDKCIIPVRFVFRASSLSPSLSRLTNLQGPHLEKFSFVILIACKVCIQVLTWILKQWSYQWGVHINNNHSGCGQLIVGNIGNKYVILLTCLYSPCGMENWKIVIFALDHDAKLMFVL